LPRARPAERQLVGIFQTEKMFRVLAEVRFIFLHALDHFLPGRPNQRDQRLVLAQPW